MVRYHSDKIATIQSAGICKNPNQVPRRPEVSRTVDLSEGTSKSAGGESVSLRLLLPKQDKRRRPAVNYDPRIPE